MQGCLRSGPEFLPDGHDRKELVVLTEWHEEVDQRLAEGLITQEQHRRQRNQYWRWMSGYSAVAPGGWFRGQLDTAHWTKGEALEAVEHVARAIVAEVDDPRLRWSKDRRAVRVRSGLVITAMGSKPLGSTAGAVNRSNRWVNALNERMRDTGWKRHGSGWWRKVATD